MWTRNFFAVGTIVLLMSNAASASSPCPKLFNGIESKEALVLRVQSMKPKSHGFIKDAPVMAYRITSRRFGDIPEAIVRHLGAIDQSKYTPEYLEQNIGSAFALQMNGDKPDFYIIGKATFDAKYAIVDGTQIAAKNAKYLSKLSQQIPKLIASGDTHLLAVLKMAPVPMLKMSEVGFPVLSPVTIESPWGEQTKPAGQDAFLVFDESVHQYYMVNSDAAGLPISYVPAN